MTNLSAWVRGPAEEAPLTPSPDEAAYHALWRASHMAQLEPAAMAFKGGYVADRLAWVFVAGYQAAIRHTFPDVTREGWIAFAVSEDKDHPVDNPPTTLLREPSSAAGLLSGSKSWIAASRCVDHLLVVARLAGSEHSEHLREKVCVLIKSSEDGVVLSHRDAPAFLHQLSQGRARFTNVQVDASHCYDEAQARAFGASEPPFIMLAATGFLLRHLGEAQGELKDMLLETATGLSALCQTGHWSAKRLASLDSDLQAAVPRFERAADLSLIPDWEADRALLSLYSPRVQKAAANAA